MSEQYILLTLFTLASILYLVELAWIWMGPVQYTSIPEPDYTTPVTLMISARDEEKNIIKNIDSWLSQNHNGYELLIINDCSDDDSEFILAEYQRKHPHLQVINLKETNVFKGGKKVAITLGIKGAQFQRIVFTDADCVPSGPDWLAHMSAQFFEEREVVLGIGHYEKTKGFLNYLIRMDTIQIAIQYLGLAARGYPYMGVGRNLAYTKDVFFEAEGFKSHHYIKWGDDDLFVNQVSTRSNTAICVIPEAATKSEAKSDFISWYNQKRRHMSTSGNYKLQTKLFLLIKPIRMLSYYSILILGLLYSDFYLSFSISALILYFAHAFIFLGLNKKMGKVEAFLLFPFTELLLFLINCIIYFSTWLKKPTKWI